MTYQLLIFFYFKVIQKLIRYVIITFIVTVTVTLVCNPLIIKLDRAN